MYSEHYGLTGNPFQLTPDARFWFESETHKKAMAYLGYGLSQGEGFIVITGDIGAGKTTLVGHLMATVDTTRLTPVQIVSTQVEGDGLLRLVAQQFGIESHGWKKAELLDRIERFLHAQAREGRKTLLIVDEAQNLSVEALEELRMLSNFQSAGRALLQIFLLGQPEFRDRVKSAPNLEQLRQRVIATHHLSPMHASEIEPYIAHRMKIAGWQGRPQFASEAFAVLYAATNGVPRRLNTLMARVLLFGAVEDLDIIDAQAVEAVVADLSGDSEPVETARAAPEPHEATPAPDVYAELAAVPEAQSPAPSPAPGPAKSSASGDDLHDRIAVLEARIDEQDAALRRVLTLLVQWVEEEEDHPGFDVVRGSAA
ncbi:XrtA/PEP-CTERM system-associated ATPase [Parasphingopyxis marina]|uniref:AAA family ATPase n=1 Tax=Parasphingopyxis marina TaxID=2761622 RepID=A0A842I294_9SPHN|nr:XrtA/PEP-CTERM system-associated ATPase [Parasphingopyxis marina]MBC2777924.1 AAA family ATPase [Parasphingopyxis marina]